ncbi:PAN domain-containing protein At5g03700 [Magnolia sinica]|uniref:PAN domain-containing protein At5g03700 n=1 Tax=Magnolia sinica TaxID=86752 RepID=UPI0026597913|nr:PAN domain-containing protein At5g03700 [Magnolia sinica]
MTLRSSNGLYSMRVIHDYLGLYADFKGESDQIYWKHTAMEAKAQIEEGLGPIYARVDSDGFLGLYQTEKARVDVMAFTSFYRGVTGFRRLRLDPDGNLRAHFWNSTSWVTEFEAIQDSCELPSACGAYGFCQPGKGCSCLDNRTEFSVPSGCSAPESGDFCGGRGGAFWELRKSGVDLLHKELMGFEKVGSFEECEGSCMRNCSCWGAVFSNVSGFCYRIWYPIQTVLGFGDATRVGFFKIRLVGKGKEDVGFGAAGVLLVIGGVGVLGTVVGFVVWLRWWRRRKERESMEGDDLSPGPYRDLKKSLRTDSFKSVELCRR